MEAEKIDLRGVPETMLQTLYARARATEKGLLQDETARELVGRMEYDFSLAEKDSAMSTGVVARTLLLDRLVKSFLEENPGAVVVNLACGLDTRCRRMAGRYERWYNLDLPETMELRRRFLKEEAPVFSIAASAADPGWGEQVEQTREPVLVVIEGLTMYLTEEQVQAVFAGIRRRFAHARVLVEIMNPLVVRSFREKSIQGSGARFTWGAKSGQAMQSLIPAFRHLRDVSLTEGMKEFLPVYRLLTRIPPVRNLSNKIVVFER